MIINSLLDTDIYKIYMGQAALFFFPNVKVKYQFMLREDRIFPDNFDVRLREEIAHLSTLRLYPNEYKWLKNNPNIYTQYLNWFSSYHFDPNEVKIGFDENELSIDIEGPWIRTIYWEVPLLAIISELYFSMCGDKLPTVKPFMLRKGKQLEGIPFVEFGTRRRFSFQAQESAIYGLQQSQSKGNLIGTSNPYFAMRYQILVIGTYAHEAIMVMQALGLPTIPSSCDQIWLECWKTMYGKSLNVALSDTLTTDHFLKTVEDRMFHLLDGIRQDSGDPIEVGKKILTKWDNLGIDPMIKNIVFSDNLNPEKVVRIWDFFKDKTLPIFGIGTNLTNDFGPKPLNMVIKVIEANGIPVIKISDDPRKSTWDDIAVKHFKEENGIV